MTRAPARPRPWADRSGSVVVEFALVIPFLLTLLLGLYDFGPTLMVKFKVGSATQTVADLATQNATMQASDVFNFFNAGADAMAPFSSAALQLRITNVASDGQGRAFVYWSCARGSYTPLTALSTVTTTPDGTPIANLLTLNNSTSGNFNIVGANTSYVVVESTYNYNPPAGIILPSTLQLLTTGYAMPRVSTYIGPTTGDASYVPVVPTSTRNAFAVSQSGVSCSIGY